MRIIILTDGLFIDLARHKPMERANWASPFLGQHSGLGCFIGPASPLWPHDGRLFLNPINVEVFLHFVMVVGKMSECGLACAAHADYADHIYVNVLLLA